MCIFCLKDRMSNFTLFMSFLIIFPFYETCAYYTPSFSGNGPGIANRAWQCGAETAVKRCLTWCVNGHRTTLLIFQRPSKINMQLPKTCLYHTRIHMLYIPENMRIVSLCYILFVSTGSYFSLDSYPANTKRQKHVIFTSKLRFYGIVTCLFRCEFAGYDLLIPFLRKGKVRKMNYVKYRQVAVCSGFKRNTNKIKRYSWLSEYR